MTILLSNLKPFATGGNRQVFVHPLDSNKCIKVLLPQPGGMQYMQERSLGRWFRGESHYNKIKRDIRGYAYIESLRNPIVYRHIPRFYGVVQTDLGNGLVAQLLRDYDGGVSQTFRSRLSMARGYDNDIQRAVAEYKNFLLQNEIIISGINWGNLLSVKIEPNQERLYACDGHGSRVLIPLERFVSPMRKAKIQRLNARLDERIAEFLSSQK